MYGLGRALQILAMVDCGIALLVGVSNPSAYAIQLVILGSAVILFSLGRLLQKKARALRSYSPNESDGDESADRHDSEHPEPSV